MKLDRQRLAPIGLILSCLSLMMALGFYWIFREFNLIVQIFLGLVVVGLAFFILLEPEKTLRAITGRKVRFGSNALVLTIAFVGFLVLINYLVLKNPTRWDLTVDKENSLTQDSLGLLQQLPGKVVVKAFFIPRLSSETAATAKELLEQFRINSNGKFEYEFIDPESNPIAAQQAAISGNSNIVLTLGQQRQLVTTVSEQALASGLLHLINPKMKKVYFLAGHGERDIQSSDPEGYAKLKNDLELKNYSLESMALLAVRSIPKDASLIVIAGPREPFDRTEIEIIDEYLKDGGALAAWIDPILWTQSGEGPEPLTLYLEESWGILLGKDVVVDLTTSQATLIAYGVEYGNHPITKSLQNNYTVFPSARSTLVENRIDQGVSQVNLVLTGDNSWAETDLDMLQQENAEVSPDEGGDLFGPIPLAVSAENFTSEARVVVVGDADFGSNAFYLEYGNRDLIINMIDWAAGQEQLINMTPGNITERVVLPPQDAMRNLIFLLIVVILPLLALASGVIVWIERRRKG